MVEWKRKVGGSEEFTIGRYSGKFKSTQARMSDSVNPFAGYPIKFKSKLLVKAEFGI